MTFATKEELLEYFDDMEDCGCDSCDFKTEELHLYKDRCQHSEGIGFWASCDICFTTLTSVAHRYPDQFPNVNAMKVTAYCTNLILEKIDGATLL